MVSSTFANKNASALLLLLAVAASSVAVSPALAFRSPSLLPPLSLSSTRSKNAASSSSDVLALSRRGSSIDDGRDADAFFDEGANKDDDEVVSCAGIVDETIATMSRRAAFVSAFVSSSALLAPVVAGAPPSAVASAEEMREESMYAPKFVQEYPDFVVAPEGWSYKDVKAGTDIGGAGDLKDGDRVVFDWSGYTIGYFGRPFEAKGGPQGGAFDKDISYFRTTLGSGRLIRGLECSLRDMRPGGIRQVIVPYGPLSYPADDMDHERVGPKPTTFSGMRALNFVLANPRVDRTLLFNVKLVRVDRSDGKGGYIRG